MGESKEVTYVQLHCKAFCLHLSRGSQVLSYKTQQSIRFIKDI